jgi:hypothetical protein
MAKKRDKDEDDDDGPPGTECWHCKGNCTVEVTYDGSGPKSEGGTGADFEACPTCNGKGYL